MSTDFDFQPADFCPVKDRELLARLAAMTPEQIAQHDNPEVNIRIISNAGVVILGEKFTLLKDAGERGERFSTIFGNPNPTSHMALAELINRHRVDCKHCVFVTMDEWADQDGNIAPDTYRAGFTYSFKKYFIE